MIKKVRPQPYFSTHPLFNRLSRLISFSFLMLPTNNSCVLPAAFNRSKLHSRRMAPKFPSERFSLSANWIISALSSSRTRKLTWLFQTPIGSHPSYSASLPIVPSPSTQAFSCFQFSVFQSLKSAFWIAWSVRNVRHSSVFR